MPAIAYYAIVGGAGFVGGLWAGGAAEQVSSAVKWVAIGGVVFIAAKAFKVI